MHPAVEIDRERIARFCRDNGIRKLSLFGSVLTDEFGPDSDIDLLVEFEEDKRTGLLGLAGLENQLSEMLGRKVDLRTPAELSEYFRDEVLNSAEVLFRNSRVQA